VKWRSGRRRVKGNPGRGGIRLPGVVQIRTIGKEEPNNEDTGKGLNELQKRNRDERGL